MTAARCLSGSVTGRGSAIARFVIGRSPAVRKSRTSAHALARGRRNYNGSHDGAGGIVGNVMPLDPEASALALTIRAHVTLFLAELGETPPDLAVLDALAHVISGRAQRLEEITIRAASVPPAP